MNKFVVFALLIVLALAVLTGCASATPAPQPAVSSSSAGAPVSSAASVASANAAIPCKISTTEPVSNFDPKVTAKKRYKIAVIFKNFLPVWMTHQKAAEQAGKDMGVDITVLTPTKADNVEEQIRILEDIINKGVDGVVLAPTNTQAIAVGIKKLNQAGIPVIYDNTMGSGGDYVAYVGVDNIKVGEVLGEEMAKRMNGKGKLLVLEGVPGQQTSDDRIKGIKNIMTKYPGIEYAVQTAHWQMAEGQTVAQDYLQRWPDLRGVVGVGGNMSEGAAEALTSAGKIKDVVIGSFDVQEPTVKAMQAGKVAFTISQDVRNQAYYSVAAMVKCLNGEAVPQQIRTNTVIVTPEMGEKYKEY
ncbi:MAG: sugar ABC transporter substrate-binding protein [Chloroflexi bacterium]|nr:sugar ABC transporter substrate-binding protein [Chloroflexota bacterium]